MVFKGIILLDYTATFNEDIRKWRQQTTNLKIWYTFKIFFHLAHSEKRRAVATSGKGNTQRQYKTYTVYLHPHQKIITR